MGRKMWDQGEKQAQQGEKQDLSPESLMDLYLNPTQ